MNMNNQMEESEASILHTYNRFPVVFDHGEGVHLYDSEGKKYLDFAAGIAVNSLGYHYPGYDEALKEQIDKLTHISNLYYNEPMTEAGAKLVNASRMDKAFFTNSGTEAIEGALKAAKKYAYIRDGHADHEIIAMNHSFHGRSIGALSVTGNAHYREPFEPLMGGVKFADFNDLDSVKAQITDKTCAIIMETVQGEGGIYPAEREFLEGVRALCDEKDIILILDEIQCGMGRTGYYFAWQAYGVQPDIVIGCAGGGSNLGGLITPFMADKLEGKNNIHFIAVEPASCPSLTRGRYAFDFGDTGQTTPLMRMYTLGSGFMPSPNHSGGLRYHGMSPIVSKLYHDGMMEARSVEQTKVFEAATMFCRCEGTLPAPESSHAIRVAMDEAIKCRETGEKKVIVFGLTGTGYFDLAAYQAYNQGTMVDYVPTDEDLEKGFATLPKVEY